MKRLSRARNVERYETVRLHKDGSLIDVAVTGFAQIDSAGDVTGVTTSTRDITERAQAEQALAESDGRYREILDATPDGVWRLDADGRTDYVNPRMASMIGYSPEEMIGHQITDFMTPADLEIAQAAITNNREHDRTGVVEHALERKDGTSCCVRVSQRALTDARGKHIGGLAILSDITAAKAQAVGIERNREFPRRADRQHGRGSLRDEQRRADHLHEPRLPRRSWGGRRTTSPDARYTK